MDHLIKTDSAEYRIRFVRRLKSKGFTHYFAVDEFNFWYENFNDCGRNPERGNPELDADISID